MRENKPLVIAGKIYESRLLVGTGKYPTYPIMAQALEESGTQIVTVALGRVDLNAIKGEGLFDYLDLQKYTILPNTAGAFSVKDAVRIAHLSKTQGWNLLKLEVLSDTKTLLPDPIATLEAAKILVEEGFDVMVYTSDDPILARKLEAVGVTAVMPAGSPIGSGQGIINTNNIKIILEEIKCPVIVDAGMGTASDVAFAMELGVDALLVNTGIAGAKDPVSMARAFKLSCEAGRLAYYSGRIPKKMYATASSPLEGFSNQPSSKQ